MKVKATGKKRDINSNPPWEAGSGLRPLLPYEPRIVNSPLQTELTEKFLLPQLAPKALQGCEAFRAFLSAGGALRQVWGDLRGEFFQNAFQLGTLYVDVSNDTVVPSKPKVEILPFAQAQLFPIADYRHFMRIAERYWKEKIFPNHVLPELAPFCPLIHINPMGAICLRASTKYMLALTKADRFRPSEAVLRSETMPVEISNRVRKALDQNKLKLPDSPEMGRKRALQLCQMYRDKRWHDSDVQTRKILAEVKKVNQSLRQKSVRLAQQEAVRKTFSDSSSSAPSESRFQFLPVSTLRHSSKRWLHKNDFRFASEDMLVIIKAQELPKVRLSLPVGFIEEDGVFNLVAVQGLNSGENYCVDSEGRWVAGYIPEIYCAYPFALLHNEAGEKILCVDENSGLITNGAAGESIISEEGNLAPAVIKKLELLTKIHENLRDTIHICTVLQENRLLQPWPIKVRKGARELEITGLYRADAAALESLPGSTREKLQNSGALPAAYYQLTSMRQLQTLVELARTQV